LRQLIVTGCENITDEQKSELKRKLPRLLINIMN
jgi:hypothetical protein